MRTLIRHASRPNRHWTDEERASRRLGGFADRRPPNTLGAWVGLMVAGCGFGVLVFGLAVLLFSF